MTGLLASIAGLFLGRFSALSRDVASVLSQKLLTSHSSLSYIMNPLIQNLRRSYSIFEHQQRGICRLKEKIERKYHMDDPLPLSLLGSLLAGEVAHTTAVIASTATGAVSTTVSATVAAFRAVARHVTRLIAVIAKTLGGSLGSWLRAAAIGIGLFLHFCINSFSALPITAHVAFSAAVVAKMCVHNRL